MKSRLRSIGSALVGSCIAALGGCSPSTAPEKAIAPAAAPTPSVAGSPAPAGPSAQAKPPADAPTPPAPGPTLSTPSAAVTAAAGPSIKRVGGDLAATIEGADGNYRSGPAKIDTPLPVGYPAPTPPGAIDIKTYPSVRRAEVSGEMAPDLGMNIGFFPLFNHIKRRNIEMTSPVEMDYTKATKEAADRGEPGRWTMSFLYRTSDLGATGTDEANSAVKIIDTAPVTVLSLGFMGPYGINRARAGEETLRAWLAGQTEWEAAGDVRTFSYNGPDVPNPRKWGEVQLPIKRKTN